MTIIKLETREKDESERKRKNKEGESHREDARFGLPCLTPSGASQFSTVGSDFLTCQQ